MPRNTPAIPETVQPVDIGLHGYLRILTSNSASLAMAKVNKEIATLRHNVYKLQQIDASIKDKKNKVDEKKYREYLGTLPREYYVETARLYASVYFDFGQTTYYEPWPHSSDGRNIGLLYSPDTCAPLRYHSNVYSSSIRVRGMREFLNVNKEAECKTNEELVRRSSANAYRTTFERYDLENRCLQELRQKKSDLEKQGQPISDDLETEMETCEQKLKKLRYAKHTKPEPTEILLLPRIEDIESIVTFFPLTREKANVLHQVYETIQRCEERGGKPLNFKLYHIPLGKTITLTIQDIKTCLEEKSMKRNAKCLEDRDPIWGVNTRLERVCEARPKLWPQEPAPCPWLDDVDLGDEKDYSKYTPPSSITEEAGITSPHELHRQTNGFDF